VISCQCAEDSKENEKFYHSYQFWQVEAALVVHLNLARASSQHGFMRFFCVLYWSTYTRSIY
jgi:hypothetical protein